MVRWSGRMSRRRWLGGLAACAVIPYEARAQAPAATAPRMSLAVQPIEISARRVTTFSKLSNERTFGRLEFRGGLVLSSWSRDFGGWSGLAVEPDGRGFISVSDESHWMVGDIVYDGSAPTGISNARIGPILALNGREIVRKRDGDAEALALLDGNLTRGTVLISFERNHRIGRFPIVDRVLQPPAGYLRMPAEARQMRTNKGLEALTVMAGGPHRGSVVALSERFPSPDGHHVGWIWIAGEPRRFAIEDIGEFELTDCAGLPDGSLLVLERRFRWTEGVKMRLRLLAPSEITPGVLARGTVLLSADMSSEIDNMEGLAVHRDARGTTILTLISDDNFNSFLQRTILLQFAFA